MKRYPDALRQQIKPHLRAYMTTVAEGCADSDQHEWAAKAYREAMRHGLFSPSLALRYLKSKFKA